MIGSRDDDGLTPVGAGVNERRDVVGTALACCPEFVR
jgi:hypothetical protein